MEVEVDTRQEGVIIINRSTSIQMLYEYVIVPERKC